MSYQIYDVNGYVGELATTMGLKLFREYVEALEESFSIREFLEQGSSLLTENLFSDLYAMKSDDEDLRRTIFTLQKLAEKADTVIILNSEEGGE